MYCQCKPQTDRTTSSGMSHSESWIPAGPNSHSTVVGLLVWWVKSPNHHRHTIYCTVFRNNSSHTWNLRSARSASSQFITLKSSVVRSQSHAARHVSVDQISSRPDYRFLYANCRSSSNSSYSDLDFRRHCWPELVCHVQFSYNHAIAVIFK